MQQCGVVESTHVESSRSSLIGRFMACKSRLEDDCKSGAIRRNPAQSGTSFSGIRLGRNQDTPRSSYHTAENATHWAKS